MADELPDYEGGAGRRIESMPIAAPMLEPAPNWYAITPGTAVLDPPVIALWANQDCDITVSGANDVSLVFAVSKGPVDLAPTKVTAISDGTVYGLHR